MLAFFCDVGAQLKKGRLLDQDLVQLLPGRRRRAGGRRAIFLQLLDGLKALDSWVLWLVVLDAGELMALAALRDTADDGAGLGHVGIKDASGEKNIVRHGK